MLKFKTVYNVNYTLESSSAPPAKCAVFALSTQTHRASAPPVGGRVAVYNIIGDSWYILLRLHLNFKLLMKM